MNQNFLMIGALFLAAYVASRAIEKTLPAPLDPAAQATLEKMLSNLGVNFAQSASVAAKRVYVENWPVVAVLLSGLFLVSGLVYKK
jgi:hypothetical protein